MAAGRVAVWQRPHARSEPGLAGPGREPVLVHGRGRTIRVAPAGVAGARATDPLDLRHMRPLDPEDRRRGGRNGRGRRAEERERGSGGGGE